MNNFYKFIALVLSGVGVAAYTSNLVKNWDSLTNEGATARMIILIVFVLATLAIPYILGDALKDRK